MSIHTFFKSLTSTSTQRRPIRRSPPASRLCVEALEDRSVPAFLAPVDYPVEFAGPLVTADFNGDGRLDLATLGGFPNTLSVLLGNGDGSFQPARTSPFASGDAALAVGDFNRDGKPDLATNQAVRLGNGDGTFGSPLWLSHDPRYPGSEAVAAGDLNGDGKDDLVGVGSDTDFDGNTYAWVTAWLGNGDGTFATPWVIERGNKGGPVVLADFNGDRRLDVAAGGGDVLLGNGDGTLRYSHRGTGDDGAVGVADFNGDGKPDLATTYFGGFTAIERGNGDGTFQPRWTYETTAEDRGPLVVADFNGDGKFDLARTQPSSGVGAYQGLEVLLGNGDGTLRSPPIQPDNRWRLNMVAADFNGDGFPDLATTSTGMVSVLINDGIWTPASPPSITLSDVTVTEGNSGTRTATFTVTLSAASSQPVTVAYATANGTATAGSDYQAGSGTLTFAPGETTKTIPVLVSGDRLAEPNETFVVNLSSPTNATIADGQGVGTITDDEPRISIGDVTKSEGRKGQTTLFTFTVTLSAAYDQAVTMSFRTVNGTATSGSGDYVAKTGTLTFAPGETTKTITIEVKGDSKREANETFYLDLFGLSLNGLFTKNRGIGTILNDD